MIQARVIEKFQVWIPEATGQGWIRHLANLTLAQRWHNAGTMLSLWREYAGTNAGARAFVVRRMTPDEARDDTP